MSEIYHFNPAVLNIQHWIEAAMTFRALLGTVYIITTVVNGKDRGKNSKKVGKYGLLPLVNYQTPPQTPSFGLFTSNL